jgi:hypothetical protein
MTEGQAEIAALGWEIRLREEERGRETWFAVEPRALPDAHELAEKGWLTRRIGEQPEWRLTDVGTGALRIDAASRPTRASLN